MALKRMAASCNFGDYLGKALRNKFMFGISNKVTQNRLLEQSDLTLEEAQNVAEEEQMATKKGLEISGSLHKKINAMRTQTRYDRGKERKNFRGVCRTNVFAVAALLTGHIETVYNFCNIKGI